MPGSLLALKQFVNGSSGQVIIAGASVPAYQTVSGNATLASDGTLLTKHAANAQTGVYTVVAGDNGEIIRYTGAGGVTLSLTAAATLGDGFYFYLRNDSSGTITIDPNAAETIDGGATLPVEAGQGICVFTNGTLWFTIGSASAVATNFGDLSDVDVSGAADASLAVFNTGDTTWHDRTAGGDVTMDDQADFTVINNAITNAKAADMAGFTIKAKADTGTGDPTDFSVGTNTVVGRVAGDIVAAQLVTGQVADDAITNAKAANMAANTVKANATASSADPADLAVGTNTVVGRVAGNIVAAQLATGQVADGAITNAKAADMAANTVKANATASTADPADLSVGTNTVVGRVAGNIVAAQLATGQVADDAITNAKAANMAGFTIKAKTDTGAGDPTDFSVGTNTVVGRVAGDIVAAQVVTAQIAIDAVDSTILDLSDTYNLNGGGGDIQVADTPATGTSAVNQNYVDSVAQGLAPQNSVVVRAQGNINLAAPGATIDGITMNVGDRFLADQQSTATQDGVYVFQGAATPATRATDFAIGTAVAGFFVFVQEGTDADAGFVFTNDDGSDIVNTDDLIVAQFSGAGQIIAGVGLVKSVNTLTLALDELSTSGTFTPGSDHVTGLDGGAQFNWLWTTIAGAVFGSGLTVTAGVAAISLTSDTFTPTASQTVFTLSAAADASCENTALVNGVAYIEGTDYTISGTTFTWLDNLFTLDTTDCLEVRYWA